MDAQERLIILKSILGNFPKSRGSEIIWACPFCQQIGKDTNEDNFSFNVQKNVYACVAIPEHTKQISGLIRDKKYINNPQFKARKIKTPDYLSLTGMPQEIKDYWIERKISLEALQYFKVKYDQANVSMDFPTNTFQDKKKLLFHEEKNRSNWKQRKIGANTIYPVKNKYEGQKKFIYLEGEPDIWCMYSNFPKEFFQEYYVATTLYGAAHIPELWKDPKYWENFDSIYLISDADEAGDYTVKKLKSIITSNVKIIKLPFKHQRIVNGIEIFYTSKDFNDWIIEGGTYQDFVQIIERDNIYSQELEEAIKALAETPNKLEILLNDVHKLGIVEEDTNIVLIFLCMLSHKFDDCLGFVLKGRFSSGKSVIVKAIGDLFPRESILYISSFSKLALQYMFDLSHKILIQTEEPPADDPAYWELFSQFRQLISEKTITRVIVEKDPKTNKMVAGYYSINGPIAYGSTTTQSKICDENESRILDLQTNDTLTHISKVKEMFDKKAMGLWTTKEEQELIINKWQKYINKLPKYKMQDIQIPFANKLEMQMYGPDAIRDYDKLQKLLKIVAYLDILSPKVRHATWCEKSATVALSLGQNAELSQTDGVRHAPPEREVPYVIVKPKHYTYIYPLIQSFFNSKATRISQSVYRYYERIKGACRSLPFDSNRIAPILQLGKRQAQRLIREWLEEDMITRLEELGEHGRPQYKVNEDWEIIDAELTLPKEIENANNGRIKQEDGQVGKSDQDIREESITRRSQESRLPQENTQPMPRQVYEVKTEGDIPEELKKIFSISKPPEEEK